MSMLIEYIILSISIIYLIVIILFAIGWKKLHTSSETEVIETVPVSIVIACRNEEKNCNFPLHHSCFNMDEDALPLGAAMHCLCALNFPSALKEQS